MTETTTISARSPSTLARGDARRPARARARRGRRRGRPVGRDRRARRGVRRRARPQHADQRGGDQRASRSAPRSRGSGRCSRSCSSTSSRSRSTSSSNAAAKAHFMSGGQLTVPLVAADAGRRRPAGRARSTRRASRLADARAGAEGGDAEHGRPTRPACSRARSPTRTRSSSSRTRRSTSGAEEVPGQPAAGAARPRARRAAPGRDVTVVALSRLVHEALAAAERARRRGGIEVEVIDPRTLVPLDLRDDRRLGAADAPARRRARGGRARRLRRGDRGAACRRRLRRPRRAGRAGRRPVRAGSRSARRSRTRTCPAGPRSSPPSARLWAPR